MVAIVISDFGRDAALRFCLALSQEERRYIQETYLKEYSFFDEYRRIILALIGDLPFAKSKILNMYRDRYLDNQVLIGFPGGCGAKFEQSLCCENQRKLGAEHGLVADVGGP